MKVERSTEEDYSEGAQIHASSLSRKGFFWHGTPVPPQEMGALIEPRQAISGGKPHGPKGVAADRDTWFPRVRSLFDGRRFDTAFREAVLFDLVPSGERDGHFMVDQEFLRELAENSIKGYLYRLPDSDLEIAAGFSNPIIPAEVRLPEPVEWDVCFETGVGDLPENLWVANGSAAWERDVNKLPRKDRIQTMRRLGWQACQLRNLDLGAFEES